LLKNVERELTSGVSVSLPRSTKQGDGDGGDGESETEIPYAKLVFDEEEMRIYQCLANKIPVLILLLW
jgi:hypothetical protein